MLCNEEYDEAELLTGVGPSGVSNRCLGGCCPRTVRLQIRTRYAYGAAALCAEFVDPAGDPDVYHTEKTTTTTYTQWQEEAGPDTELGTCVFTRVQNSGSAAIATWSDPEHVLDCDAAPTDESYSPAGCIDTLYDPPVDYVTTAEVITYGGDTATADEVQDAAIGALAFGDWSEWTDVVEIDIDHGSFDADYLSLYLAESGRGSSPFNGWQIESELRVLGAFKIHVAVSEGAGALGTLPVVRYTLEPGTPVTFTPNVPSFAEDWLSEVAVLRCVCPFKFAPV